MRSEVTKAKLCNGGFAILNSLLALFVLTMLINLSFYIPRQIIRNFSKANQEIYLTKEALELSPVILKKLTCKNSKIQGQLLIRNCEDQNGNHRLRFIEQY